VISEPSLLPVLVVEDDVPTQNLLRTVLRRCGYSSEIAANGLDAIALLRGRDYALIVLDVMMPGVGGREVVEYLSGKASTIPVIICSAAGTKALAGFDSTVVKAIVLKPFDVDEFIETVTRVVDGT
jgi:two-component system response regulator ResD